MRKKQMGRTDVMVSELCLGTMTFGTQTREPEAHAQIDLSLERGINFLDTAEMYPVNPCVQGNDWPDRGNYRKLDCRQPCAAG